VNTVSARSRCRRFRIKSPSCAKTRAACGSPYSFGSSYCGSHGYQFNRSYATTNAYSLSGGIRAVFRNGVPDSVNTYNTLVNYAQYNNDHAVYIQDRWTPLKKLTLNLGLRYESFYGYQPAACQPQTPWVAGQCFPAIEGAPDFSGVVPRVSAVYDVFGNGRTAVKIAANRYYMPQGVSLITRINPLVVTNGTRSWRDTNADLTAQIDALGPSTGFNFGTTNRFSPGLEWPNAREYSVELQHQLPGSIVIPGSWCRESGVWTFSKRCSHSPASCS
jgi:outer membrane receptor protein involved in Fe transport